MVISAFGAHVLHVMTIEIFWNKMKLVSIYYGKGFVPCIKDGISMGNPIYMRIDVHRQYLRKILVGIGWSQ
jgi:hypothetical protein